MGQKLAKEKNVGLALRWKFNSESGTPTPLTGYGVQLRLKSTEYKAQVRFLMIRNFETPLIPDSTDNNFLKKASEIQNTPSWALEN